jgi:chromosome segregation ATPase
MICPKCGFEQEKRLDCRECGVIFSKYNALFQSAEGQDMSAESASALNEIQELQIQMRDLSSRLIDAEFEKAERKKLRSDVRDLEDLIQSEKTGTEARLRQIEEKLASQPEIQGAKIPRDLQGKLSKIDEIEQKTTQLSDILTTAIDQCTNLWEKTGQNSYQISEFHKQIVALRNEVLELRGQLENLQENQTKEEPQTIAEDDIRAIRRNLDQLGQFISELGRRP